MKTRTQISLTRNQAFSSSQKKIYLDSYSCLGKSQQISYVFPIFVNINAKKELVTSPEYASVVYDDTPQCD